MSEFEKMSKIQFLQWAATTARTEGRHVAVSDVRYITHGIPTAVNDEFIYFAECWEVDETQVLGGKPKSEKLPKGGKLILWAAVSTIEFILKA